ncbi:MAG: class E sortase [Actinobacteria bacterium]|nr:class E sortase [Actinomycetota bacterium]
MTDRRPSGFSMPEPGDDHRSTASGFLLDAVRHRRVGRQVLSGLIVLLFVAGAGMFTYPFFTDLYTNQVVQERLSDQFVEQFENAQIETFDQWRASVQEGRALTKIVIPSIGVETLVVEGTSAEALRAGAGHYPNTPLPGQDGNVAIAGHRTTYGRPFNQMDRVPNGAKVWLITPVGEYEYEVVSPPEGYRALNGNDASFVTNPKDWQIIAPTSDPSLTLTSCHPKGSAAQRIVLRAERVGVHPAGTYAQQQAAA